MEVRQENRLIPLVLYLGGLLAMFLGTRVFPTVSAAQMKKILDYQAAHINDINASIERDRAMGAQRNVSQTPSIYVTSHGKTEALPGGGVDYKLLKQYLDYLLRQ